MSNIIQQQQQVATVTNEVLIKYLDTMGLTKQLNEAQKVQFIEIAKAYGLNPFKREIYAIPYGNDFKIITGYEVYLKRAEIIGLLDGFETKLNGSFKKVKIQKTKRSGEVYDGYQLEGDLSCTITIYRKDRSKPVVKTIYLDEFYIDSPIWLSKPRFMLEKCAIAIGFRLAFPLEFGGMPYTKEEMPIDIAQIEVIDKKIEKSANQPPASMEEKEIEPVKLIQVNEENGDIIELTIEDFEKNWQNTSLATFVNLVAQKKHKEYADSLNDNERDFVKNYWGNIKKIAAKINGTKV